MQLSAVLDVSIGLAFMYLLLSMIASTCQEILAGIFAWRGTYLSKGIDVILDNKPDGQFRFAGLHDWLTAHFTKSAGRTVAQQYAIDTAPGPHGRASLVAPNATLQKVLAVQSHPLLSGNPIALPSYIPSRDFGLALLSVLRDGSQAPLFVQVENTVAHLPPGDLKTILTVYVQDAGGDIDKLRGRLETWFDDAMDRVSGAYKRWSQAVMLVFGFFIAASLNVNTPHVVKMLWTSPDLRAAVVAQAEKAVPPASPGDSPPDPLASTAKLRDELAAFDAEQFPVGWHCWEQSARAVPLTTCHALGGPDPAAQPPLTGWRRLWLCLRYALISLPGWIMTAIAISLGAPFWFDLLQKVVNLRNAGAKPEVSRAAGPR